MQGTALLALSSASEQPTGSMITTATHEAEDGLVQAAWAGMHDPR